MKLEAVPVGSEHFPAVCDALAHFAERSGGDWTENSLHADLSSLKKQAYVAVENGKVYAVFLVQVRDLLGGGRVCELIAGTGKEREKWQGLLSELERRAKENGYTVMRHRVRPGWSRIFAPDGYRVTHHIVEKVL